MNIAKILWVDDEIESLKSQIMFLENKGYESATKTNGFDAVEYVKENIVDVVLMDESMPGILSSINTTSTILSFTYSTASKPFVLVAIS